MQTLVGYGYEIRQINHDNGWETPIDFNDPEVPTKLCLIHSEVSEALEAYRHDNEENFREEIADTIIRILDLTAGLGYNIDEDVRKKMEVNRGRGYKHGGKRV